MTNESLSPKDAPTTAQNDGENLGIKITPKKVGGGLSDLADTVAGRGLDDEEIESLIKNNWPKAALLLFVIIATIWVMDAVKANRHKVSTETVQKFADAQRYFNEVITLGEKAGEKKPGEGNDPYRAMQDSFATLKSSYSSSIYSRLSDLYLAAADLSKHDIASAKTKLQTYANSGLFNASTNYSTGGLITDDDFVNELGALLYARIQLAENQTEGRAKLLSLMKNSKFASAEAAVLFARSAKTEVERADAEREVRALVAARPEFSKKVLGSVMSDLGIELER